MRIQHNIMAMSAYRNYNTNTSALSKNLEKLSSGYKINRAGDDAAGLAISEKMRAQITGLNAAQKNVKDGISLVKTAEGAMQEIQDMLNRMDYLATQSANGTYDNEVDRMNLNKEMIALKDEINRIADSANFNGIKLLNGDLEPAAAVGDSTGPVTRDDILSTDAADTHFQYHKDGLSEQEPSFQIDLHEALEGATAKASLAANGSFSITVKVGGATITINKLAVTGSVSMGGVIKASNVDFSNASISVNGAAAGKASVATIRSGGGTATMKFQVQNNDGVLTFTKASGAVVDFNSNMEVTIAGTGTKVVVGAKNTDINDGGNDSIPASVNCKTQKTVNGVKATGTQLAHGHVEITSDMANGLVNGGKLTFAGSDITFSAGTKTTSSGQVGVKDLVTDNGDGTFTLKADKLEELVRRITVAAASNATFTVGVGSTDTTTLSLQEKYNNTSVDLTSEEKFKENVTFTSDVTTAGSKEKKGLALQIGDTSDSFNRIFVEVGDMHTTAMGTGAYVDENGNTVQVTKTIDDIDILNPENAAEAIQVIKNAINYVSSVRGDLGAVQNRLEHTANNLSVMAENIQDAESTIRDTDIAEEMMSYTKNNILVQSAQAMLAQANAVPQGVLQLLG